MTSDAFPSAVREALNVWLRCHDEVAPGLVEGLYVVGSAALGNWQSDSDIDIVAFGAAPPGDDDVERLRAAHQAAVAELGSVDIDGPRLAWRDVATPPVPLVRPWTLHGEFRHDDGCFELNPATWLTLQRYGVAVRGPATREMQIATDVASLRAFVRANTNDYWRSVAASIDQALSDDQRSEFDAAVTSWCVLGVARMLYSMNTGDIASKSAAGRWMIETQPDDHDLLEHAMSVRESGGCGPDDRTTARHTAQFVRRVADLIDAEFETR